MNKINTSAKGNRQDRSIIHELVDVGFTATKSAASKTYGKGKIDIIAIHPTRKIIYFIQDKNFKAKSNPKGNKELEELLTLFGTGESYKVYSKLISAHNYKEMLKEMKTNAQNENPAI